MRQVYTKLKKKWDKELLELKGVKWGDIGCQNVRHCGIRLENERDKDNLDWKRSDTSWHDFTSFILTVWVKICNRLNAIRTKY